MRKTPVFASAAAALTLAFVSLPVHAAEEEQEAAAAPMTPEQIANIKRAGEILRAFTVAMQEKEVQEPVKGRLLACLYNNKLSTISAAAGDTIKANPQLSEDRPGDVYRAAAGVCGIAFRRVEEAAPPPPSGSTQEGR